MSPYVPDPNLTAIERQFVRAYDVQGRVDALYVGPDVYRSLKRRIALTYTVPTLAAVDLYRGVPIVVVDDAAGDYVALLVGFTSPAGRR